MQVALSYTWQFSTVMKHIWINCIFFKCEDKHKVKICIIHSFYTLTFFSPCILDDEAISEEKKMAIL